MSQTEERKSRFEISREVQTEFVNQLAQSMLAMGQKTETSRKPWQSGMSMPYSPATGREFGGPNMVRLLLAGVEHGYRDDRWLTYKQIQKLKEENPELNIGIKKGMHGVKLLRPEEVFYSIDKESGKWTFMSQEQAREIEKRNRQGEKLPPVQHKTLFYPFTVFNAEQIYGMPPKENPAPVMSKEERNQLLERFVACSGVVVAHHHGPAAYDAQNDTIRMPFPDAYPDSGAYYADKMRNFYQATGVEKWENRQGETQNLKTVALEEMRAEMFSMIAGVKYNLPMPNNSAADQLANWNQKFSGGDVKEVFKAAADAAMGVALMHQFEAEDAPKSWWYPKPHDWENNMRMQAQKDAECGLSLRENAFTTMDVKEISKLDDVVGMFNEDDPVGKACLILKHPEFLDLAMREDPDMAMELVDLCEHVARELRSGIEEKLRDLSDDDGFSPNM